MTIQALDAAGNPVYTASGDVRVTVQGADLLALGNADPKPDRLTPFTENTCPPYGGMALAVIRSTPGGKGCLIQAVFHGETVSLPLGFTPAPEAKSEYVGESVQGGALDATLGQLLANEKALAVLRTVLGPMLDNPMIASMQGMSLRKLLSMGGQSLPESVVEALNQAMA